MNAYEEKQEAKKERFEERAARARGKADALYAKGRHALEQIPFGQPILVGHHSEKGDRAYRGRAVSQIDRSFQESDKAEYYERRAESVGTAGISSDDPDAIPKLTEKLAALVSLQERMKEGNAQARKEGKEKPFAGYQLTNNNANIRSTKKRIEELQKKASMVALPAVVGNGYTKLEDVEDNRIWFIFTGIPGEDVRGILKSNGFKWSPSRKAWVRMFNQSGRYAAQRVIDRISVL